MESRIDIEESVADQIYDILVEHAGALKDDRMSFVGYHTRRGRARDTSEWPFFGVLGVGGKFWVVDGRHFQLFVNCHPEDVTPERTEIIDTVNRQLEKIRDSLVLSR